MIRRLLLAASLLRVCGCGVAFADSPARDLKPDPLAVIEQPRAVVPAAPVVADRATTPDLANTALAPPDLAAKLSASDTALHALADRLGVPMATKLPAAWLDTPTGKGLTIALAIVGAGIAAAQTGVAIRQQFHSGM